MAGLTIASPLVGDPALGTINPNAFGILVNNSNILIDKNYIIDAGNGIWVITSGANSAAPQIINNGVIGNINGIVVQDGGSTNPATMTSVINNTIAFNTNGMIGLNTAATSSEQAYVANNIFWQNHDQTAARTGVGISSQTLNKLVLNNNMFSGNGTSDTNASGAAANIGNGFDPAKLGPTASDAAPTWATYTGYPSFVAPRDPRPFSDGEATFLLDANFGLTATSAAINNALESVAPKTDFLGNLENPNPTTKGFHLPGFGPRDVGAFEFEPLGTTGTTAVGGTFRVVTTSLVPDGAGHADGASLTVYSRADVRHRGLLPAGEQGHGRRDRPPALGLGHQPALAGEADERHLARRPYGPVQPHGPVQFHRHAQRVTPRGLDQEPYRRPDRGIFRQGGHQDLEAATGADAVAHADADSRRALADAVAGHADAGTHADPAAPRPVATRSKPHPAAQEAQGRHPRPSTTR